MKFVDLKNDKYFPPFLVLVSSLALATALFFPLSCPSLQRAAHAAAAVAAAASATPSPFYLSFVDSISGVTTQIHSSSKILYNIKNS